MANKNEILAKEILNAVGGEENVTFVTHCMTRLRMNFVDRSIVTDEKLNAIPGVIGVKWAGDQCQVIIGTTVNNVYDEFNKLGNFQQGGSIDENLDEPKEKEPFTIKRFFGNILKTVAEIMVPVIALYITMGMFAALTAIFGPQGFNLINETSGFYRMLDYGQTAINYFVPFFIAYSAAKRFHVTPLFAMGLVAVMMYPQFLDEITNGTFALFGLTPAASALSTQTIPVMLAVWLMSYVENFLKKHMPASLQYSLNGTLCILIMLPICLFILNPIGDTISQLIAAPVSYLYGIAPAAVAGLMGLVWLPLIATGMHMVVAGIFYGTFFMTGSEFALFPVMRAIGFVGAAANIAIALRTKNNEEKHLSYDGIIALLVGGVIEPSLYGLYIKHPRTLVATCVGLGVAGLVGGLLHVGVFAFPANGIFGITSVLAGGTGNFINFCIATLIGCAVTAVMILVGGLDGKKKN
ncbi:MAG: PTS transporter subunit EIIC [Solobacterium sp.]|nr:PTS transporter subunit EIIC [Solobacterium sp.]